MSPGERGATRSLLLIAHGGGELAQVHSIGWNDRFECGWQRQRLHGLAARRHGDIQIAEVDAGVLGSQILQHQPGDEPERGQLTLALKELDGLRTARRDFFEPLGKMRLVEGLVAFGSALGDERVAKEFVIAKDILRGLLIVPRRPVAGVFLEIRRRGVGEIVGGKRCFVVEGNQIVDVGELPVNVVVAVSSPSPLSSTSSGGG